MLQKLKRGFTVIIVPHDAEQSRSFRAPLWAFQAMGILFFIFITGFLVLYHNAGNLRDTVAEYQNLLNEAVSQKENLLKQKQIQEAEFTEEKRIQEEKIKRIAQEIQHLVMEMEELRELREAVYKKVDGLKPPKEPSTISESYASSDERGITLSRSGYANLESTLTNLARAERNLEMIKTSLPVEKENMETLINGIEEHNRRMRAIPSIRPAKGRISSGFGYRRDPFTGRTSFHNAVDISNAYGTPVYATAYGRVVSAGYCGGYGNMVIINHGYGYQTCYAHLSRIVVSVNQQVSRGGLIGYMGRTGRSTGTHLHYEVRVNGKAVNPANYF
jgi:murein DD-endopeptidase MepM/ murein hydrolase activator NlpD